MGRITIINTRLRSVTTLGALTCALLACGSSAQTRELRDARQAYRDAANDPATKHVPGDLSAARTALDRAEKAHDDDPGSDREAHLAQIAEDKADLAKAHGRLAEAHSNAEAAQAKAREDKHVANANEARDREKHAASPAREHVATPAGKPLNADQRAEAALQNLAQVANVKQEARGVVITLSGSLLFPTGKQELSPIAQQSLDQVAAAVAQQPAESKLAVEGYTDDSGSKDQNARLSQKRAQAVAEQLERRGIDSKRIEVAGYGEARPIASNDTEEGRALNRRVEIVIAPRGQDPLAAK